MKSSLMKMVMICAVVLAGPALCAESPAVLMRLVHAKGELTLRANAAVARVEIANQSRSTVTIDSILIGPFGFEAALTLPPGGAATREFPCSDETLRYLPPSATSLRVVLIVHDVAAPVPVGDIAVHLPAGAKAAAIVLAAPAKFPPAPPRPVNKLETDRRLAAINARVRHSEFLWLGAGLLASAALGFGMFRRWQTRRRGISRSV
jgi:hypothetical protein